MQVLKHEWPARWLRFIPDLVSAAKSSESLCENCMVILKVCIKPNKWVVWCAVVYTNSLYSFCFVNLNVKESLTRNSELHLLSEEVFDFSRGELTQSKIKELKNSLNKYAPTFVLETSILCILMRIWTLFVLSKGLTVSCHFSKLVNWHTFL